MKGLAPRTRRTARGRIHAKRRRRTGGIAQETTMLRRTGVLGAVVLGLVVVAPASAQDRAVGLALRGGGFNSLTSLNEPGTADFKQAGYNIGGTVGVDVHRYIGVRGDFTFARNELQQNDIATGSDLNRFFYDAALQLQY